MNLRKLVRGRYVLLALVALTLGLFLYFMKSEPEDKALMRNIYVHWKYNHSDIVMKEGEPDTVRFVNVWFQNFATGYVAYNVTDREAVVFLGLSNSFRKLPTPVTHLTPGALPHINEELLRQLLESVDPNERARYRDMVYERVRHNRVGILGGIGALYIQEKLLHQLGPPLDNERRIDNVLLAKGERYDLLVGLPIGNGGFIPSDTGSARRVAVLYPDNRFYDHREFPSQYEKPHPLRKYFEPIYQLYESNYRKPWFLALNALGTPIALYLTGMIALLLIASRRGSAFFSRNWLISMATKPLLAVPRLSCWALFLGYQRRLAELASVRQASGDYFELSTSERTGPMERVEKTRNPLHERIALTIGSQDPLVIVGEGGAGKSTVLNRLASLAIQHQLHPSLEGYVPLLVTADYYAGRLVKAISDTLRERDGVGVNEDIITSQLQSGRFLVLLDGASEVITDKSASMTEIIRTARNADYRNCRFIIATRPADFIPGDVKRFDLQPLDPRIIPSLLKDYGLEDTRKNLVLEQLKSFSGRPIDPLLLSMIVSASGDRLVSSMRSEVYERYFRKLLRAEKDSSDNLWLGWKKALERLAFHFLIDTGKRGVGLPHERLMDLIGGKQESNQIVEGLSKQLRRLYHLPVEDDLDLLNQLEASGLLHRKRRWSFAHDTFEEYFAASYLVSYFNLNDDWPSLDKLKTVPESEREFTELFEFVREMIDEFIDKTWRQKMVNLDLPKTWKAKLAL